MKYFMDIYNNFEKDMKFIHIAGTNGKGSCTEIISNILINQGYKVGKFLSPHLINYNERISINKIDISDKNMVDLIEELKPLIENYNKREEVNITFFELETIMALLYFYRNNVDFVVLETGLGGKYDCTNIITKPIVSIITSIGYDHMHILGDTLPQIASEKAGIVKKGSNTVIFDQEPNINDVFINKCKAENNKLHIIRENYISNYSFDDKYQYFSYKNYSNLCTNLKGKVQIKNSCLCVEAMDILSKCGYTIDENSIRNGLKTVVHRGRMEELNTNPKIVYDGAHNKPAIQNLLDTVKMYYSNYKRVYIVSIIRTKDYKKILELLATDDKARFILTTGNDKNRYISNDVLFEYMNKIVDTNRIRKLELNDAISDAMNQDKQTVSLVVGSFYVYGTVVEIIIQ